MSTPTGNAATATASIMDSPRGGFVILRVGPWALPMTDQQLRCMDRLIARARDRQLPFVSIQDDNRRECVAFVVEPIHHVAVLATGVAP